MAKTIALKVKFESDGEEKVIKNLGDLESAVEQLQDELKTLDFGSEEYERTTAELQKLRSTLKDVELESEGLDVEQRLSALGGALDGLSGAFLVASSAARTFGGDVETVEEIEKLEQQALEAVNIALGIRQISEAAVQANLLRRVIAEKAANVQTKIATGLQTLYTAAVGTSTGALRLFRLALIGTGIGAVIVLIGELIANWDKLTGSIGESNDSLKQYNKIQSEANKEVVKSQRQLDFYSKVVLDTTKSEEERMIALEELNKLGVISDDINLDNVESLETLADRILLVRDNLLLKAQAEAASQLLSESLQEQIEIQSSSLTDNVGWFDTIINRITSFGNVSSFVTQQTIDGYENQQEALNEVQSRIEQYEQIYLDFQEQLLENEAKLRDEREKSNKVVEERNKRTREATERDKRASLVVKEYTDRINDLSLAIGKLNTEAEVSAEILEKTQDVIDQQNELLGKRNDFFKDETATLIKEFENLIGLTLIPEDVQSATKDQFFDIFDTYRTLQRELRDTNTEIGESFVNIGDQVFTVTTEYSEDLDNNIETYERTVKVNDRLLKVTQEINKETGETITTYGDGVGQIERVTRDISSFNQTLLDTLLSQVNAEKLKQEVGEDVFQGLIDITDANTRINDQLEEYNLSLEESEKKIGFQADNYDVVKDIRQDIIGLEERGVLLGKTELERQEEKNKIISKNLFGTEDLNKLNEEQLSTIELTNKLLNNRTATLIDFNKLTDTYLELQDDSIKKNESTEQLAERRLDLLSQELFGVKSSADLTEDQLEILNSVNDELLKQVGYYDEIITVNKEFEKLSQTILENLQKQGEQITDEQFDILLNFIKQTAEGFDDISQLQPFIGVINQLKELEQFRDTFEQLKSDLESFEDVDELVGFIDSLSLSSARLLGLTEQQLSQLKTLAQTNTEELGNFIKNLNFDLVNLTEEQIQKLQELFDNIKFDKTLDAIQEFTQKLIQEFNNITSGIQNVLSTQISLQLEQLDRYEQEILTSIGDETERAREIQEETRQEIARERFDLEKKSRLQELRFGLAAAISSGAQSVLNAIATVPPPGGQILAGIYGGITAAQVAVINDQINFVKGTTFIARRGGLITGPSHEEGGVYANGGSIILEGGEAILNKNAVSQFSDLLSQINVSTGGRSLEMEDSALVQEIRKQNQRPIKTYVLYNDIQNTNKINSRLEQISRL